MIIEKKEERKKKIKSYMTLAQETTLTIFPELVLPPEMQLELAEWEKEMEKIHAMFSAMYRKLVEQGVEPEVFASLLEQSQQFGCEILPYMADELILAARRHNVLPEDQRIMVRSIGAGRGDDVEWLMLALRLGFNSKLHDWSVGALMNAYRVLEKMWHERPIAGLGPMDILERSEIGQMFGIGPAASLNPTQVVDLDNTVIIYLSRIIQHLKADTLIPLLRKLGAFLAATGKRLVIVHPYPRMGLNSEDKYVTAFKYGMVFILHYLNEGAEGKPIVELRYHEFNFMDWQTYRISSFGLQTEACYYQ